MAISEFYKNLKRTINTFIVVSIIFFIILPIIFISLIPITIFRWIVGKCAPRFRPNLSKMVTARGSVLLANGLYSTLEAFNSLVTLQLQVPPDIHQLRNLIEKTAINLVRSNGELKYPELRQNIISWMGFPFWKNVQKFDIKNHIHVLETDKLRYPLSYSEHEQVLKDLCRKHWTNDKPLWEFVIIPEIQAKYPEKEPNYCLIVFRMHHVLGDGYSILKLLSDALALGEQILKVAKPKYVKRSGFQKFLLALAILVKVPLDLFCFFMTMGRTMWNCPREQDRRITHFYAANSDTISLNFMKDIKNEQKVDFTTLILGAITGGCREMIIKQFGEEKCPKETSIVFPLPLPGHPDKMRNFLSMAMIILPVGESDPVKRLKILQKRLDELKRSTLPATISFLIKCVGCFPNLTSRVQQKGKMIEVISEWATAPFGLTNLLAPAEKIYVLGHQVDEIAGGSNLPYNPGLAYGFMFITYNGKAKFMVGGMDIYMKNNEQAAELNDLVVKQLHILAKYSTV